MGFMLLLLGGGGGGGELVKQICETNLYMKHMKHMKHIYVGGEK